MPDIVDEPHPKLAALWIHKCRTTKIFMINYKTLESTLSNIGGIGSAAYSASVVVFFALFKYSFLKDISKNVDQTQDKKAKSLQVIQDLLLKRVSYLSLYILHDRVYELEQGIIQKYAPTLGIIMEESSDSEMEELDELREELEKLKKQVV